jgi:serine/threonine protein kinase/lipopolysaccharide biosynthesis regulator YciM
MELELIRSELERLFELGELFQFTERALGIDPSSLKGAQGGKGAFARALTEHCVEGDVVEALCEALLSSKPHADPRLEAVLTRGLKSNEMSLPPGSPFGPFSIVRKLGESSSALTYAAVTDDRNVRLKVLRPERVRDRRSLHRFLTLSRLAGQLTHASLPARTAVGDIGGRYYVAHDYVDAELLSTRIARTGPMHINEARDLLLEVLSALSALHARRIVHGNLKPENVLVRQSENETGGQRTVVIDAGGDHLRGRFTNGHMDAFVLSSAKPLSPEHLRGEAPSERTDLYAFGALAFEVLTGQPPFPATQSIEAAVLHLTRMPPPPSKLAPAGWVSNDLDEFVLSLLEKRPEHRPRSAALSQEALEALCRHTPVPSELITEEELEARIVTFFSEPDNDDAALSLEAAATMSGDRARIADAFSLAATDFDESTPDAIAKKKSLLHRAARLYGETTLGLDAAERAYSAVLKIDDGDMTAIAKLEELRRRLGKYDELIEALLSKAERSQSGPERASVLGQIGELYETDLHDPEQALVAFTQAFCEDPKATEYAERVERLAANRKAAWPEVLANCMEASTGALPPEVKAPLFLRMGKWHSQHLARTDLALSCFQAVLATEPANEAAMEAIVGLYRRAQRWSELAVALLYWAGAARSPEKARDLRVDAAQVLEQRLNDVAAAQDLLVEVLEQDLGCDAAAQALCRSYEHVSEWSALARLLERRSTIQTAEARLRTLCRVAELHAERLDDDAEAIRRYVAILEEDPSHLDALRGLDRLYSKHGRFHYLLANLQAQIRLAVTPRQKIALGMRIAGLYEEEFLDNLKAATTLEEVLKLDPMHEAALSALARQYRAENRWDELADVLLRHAEAAADGARQIDLFISRASVLESQLVYTELAISAYERVLELAPQHAAALQALARLREAAGQGDAAVAAIEALAASSEAKEVRAEHWARAGRLLESRGDIDAAIERYKRSLDANPNDSTVAAALRNAYVARGDANAAIELFERQIDRTSGDALKAALLAEMAQICLTGLKDEQRAARAAVMAHDHDPTNVQALMLLGDLAFDARRYAEASAHFEKLVMRADSLKQADAVRVLIRYADALEKSGSPQKALLAMESLLRLAPYDQEALQRVASVNFHHGSARRAAELYTILLERVGEHLPRDARAEATYRMGESLRRSGDVSSAIAMLEEAADLDPTSAQPLVSLTQAYESQEDWAMVVDVKARHLDLVSGDARVSLLTEIGELAIARLSDRGLALKSLATALEERPDDRKLLMRLMYLYGEDKDWAKLVDVVLKLAEFVDDDRQRAKYLQTAAMVAGRELGEYDRALEFHARVRALDPENEKSIDEAVELNKLKGDFPATAAALKEKARMASAKERTDRVLQALTELGQLYTDNMGEMGHAIDAYEAAQMLEPNNRERNELLARLYASNPERYLAKAVAAQEAMLRQDPLRGESYKLLRRLYTEAGRVDPAWCLCQALYVLKLSDPEEERSFKRMQSEDAAYAKAVLMERDWLECLAHPDADPALTSIFALIEPAIVAQRSQRFEALHRHAIDVTRHPCTIGQTLEYAASVLGMELPPVFANESVAGGLSFLHAQKPSIVLGRAALNDHVPPQVTAFLAARHLTYHRPGYYTRQLVSTGTALKAWLSAAIKLNAPQFPVSADIEGPVREAVSSLEQYLTREARDRLSAIVSKLLQSGRALDLRKWVTGVDVTADRVGFVLCHDLPTAVEIVRAVDEGVAPQQRLKELVLFAISEPYFQIRERLGITIDSERPSYDHYTSNSRPQAVA